MKQILRYLQHIQDYGIFLARSISTQLDVYNDVDWASDKLDHKSTFGYAIFMGQDLIIWSLKK